MVRYADGPSTSVQVSIAAPCSTVWPHVVDIDLPARFSAEFQGARWLSEGGPALGAVFEGTNRHEGVGTWTTTSTVTAFAEERIFEWTVGDVDDKAARWRFDLEPDGHGSRLQFSAEMGPGASGVTGFIEARPDREEDIVANRLATWEQNMTLTVEGIKSLAERQTIGRQA